MIIRVDNELAR